MPGRLLRGLRQWWHRYRYRFVPWIALNINHNPRTLRDVPGEAKDKVISDEEVLGALLRLFQALFTHDLPRQREVLTVLPEPVRSKYQDLLSVQPPRAKVLEHRHHQPNTFNPEDVLYETLGFSVARAASSLVSAGRGVFVTKGLARKGAVVSMYPGTVYQKCEPIFFQSIGNPFIFRCLDGVLIDGNDKGISKVVYRSCSGRDRHGPLRMSDSTWLTSEAQNPLAVGQYVNNCSNDRPANVCYQEFDVPPGFPVELKQYLPNTAYSCAQQRDSIASWRSSASTKGSKNVNKMAPTNPIWLLAELSLSALTGASCSQAPSLCRPRCSQGRRPRRRASLQLLHHCPLTEQGSRFSTQSM